MCCRGLGGSLSMVDIAYLGDQPISLDAVQTPWTPADDPAGEVWVHPADTSTIAISSGNFIASITDKINGYVFSPPGEGIKTGTRTINGLNVLDNTGFANTFLRMTANGVTMNNNDSITVWAGVSLTAGNNRAACAYRSVGSTAGNLRIISDQSGGFYPAATGYGATLGGGTTDILSNFYVVSMRHSSNATTPIREIQLTGNVSVSDTVQTTTSAPSPGIFVINANHNYGNGIRGDIAFFAHFNTSSQTTVDRVHGYVAHLFGAQGDLPAAHPYKSGPPMV